MQWELFSLFGRRSFPVMVSIFLLAALLVGGGTVFADSESLLSKAVIDDDAPVVSIVSDEGWPRTITDAHGVTVELSASPQRIHTVSLGYDEITLALVAPQRVAAIGRIAVDPTLSNVVEEAERVGNTITGGDMERIVAARPDLIVVDNYTRPELLEQLRGIGVPVVVSNLHDSVDMHAANIRFLARLYGAENEAEALIEHIEQRLAFIENAVTTVPEEERPLVLRLAANGWVPGADTTMHGIIEKAGGINAAAVAGLEGWQQLSLEKVVEIRPDVIIISDYADEGGEMGMEILQHPGLQSVPAIAEQRVYIVPERYHATLSHWNVRGVEEIAKLLYPDLLGEVSFEDRF